MWMWSTLSRRRVVDAEADTLRADQFVEAFEWRPAFVG
jgi:hypothetical protein